MLNTYPASASKLSVITPGIALPSLPDGAHKQAGRLTARGRLGLPAGVPCLLFIANDFRKKGLGVVLQAMASLSTNTVLAVVGNPEQAPDFTSTVHALGMTDRVFFLGRMRDVTDAYLAADCLVHPTLEDTFAMVVLEAMAYGLPCVVSGPAFCGISGLLQHRTNALLLDDPRDAKALGLCLQALMADTDLQHALSAHALAFAAQFQWSGIAALQDAVYRSTQLTY
jgi:UDP-glucose:(heptosyl)LPS alpha-1,3-glucosyltransferase